MTRFDAVMPFDAVGVERRWFRAVPFLCALLVAAVLVTAAMGKIRSTNLGRSDLAVVIGESLVALLVLVFHARRIAWVGVAMLFGAFAGYAAQRAYSGHDCNCFGDSEWAKALFKPRVTLAIDLFGIALSLGLATAASLRGLIVPMAALLSGVATAGGVGLVYADHTTPKQFVEKHGQTPVEMVMDMPMMEDIKNAKAGDPAWLVFIYNPECHICQEHLPSFTAYNQRNARDRVLRTRVISTTEVQEKLGIELWAWDEIPTTVLFREGVEVKRYSRDNVPAPDDVRMSLSTGENKGQEAVDKLLAQPEMKDVMGATSAGAPRWLVYLYNPECPKCLDHLVTFEAFAKQAPPDADMRVRILSMADLEKSMGVQIYEWPSVPTTLLIRNGKVVRQYKSEQTPDPFDVWAESGK